MGSEGRVLRYGIIGVGMMGREHLYNLAALPGAMVVAVADPNPGSRVAALAATAGLQSVAPSPPLQVTIQPRPLPPLGPCLRRLPIHFLSLGISLHLGPSFVSWFKAGADGFPSNVCAGVCGPWRVAGQWEV